ncbi:cytochrome b-c1 complex subunit 6, mitochondrial-like [Sycon ciliatum]|uniref:cytochrome b-c1 complex subunit 6, mitochondrial-like n=1 Tax=Sycon ciliatum TaxID=27933 RepID=UPI0031F5F9C7
MAATGEEVRAEEASAAEEEEVVVVESEDEEDDVQEEGDEGDDDAEQEGDDDEEDEEDEEDPVDPLDTVKERCGRTALCSRMKARYDDCAERVSSKTNTSESCKEEFLDFVESVDNCAARYIFSHLK